MRREKKAIGNSKCMRARMGYREHYSHCGVAAIGLQASLESIWAHWMAVCMSQEGESTIRYKYDEVDIIMLESLQPQGLVLRMPESWGQLQAISMFPATTLSWLDFEASFFGPPYCNGKIAETKVRTQVVATTSWFINATFYETLYKSVLCP